jgi:hypothetical protein
MTHMQVTVLEKGKLVYFGPCDRLMPFFERGLSRYASEGKGNKVKRRRSKTTFLGNQGGIAPLRKLQNFYIKGQ